MNIRGHPLFEKLQKKLLARLDVELFRLRHARKGNYNSSIIFTIVPFLEFALSLTVKCAHRYLVNTRSTHSISSRLKSSHCRILFRSASTKSYVTILRGIISAKENKQATSPIPSLHYSLICREM